MRRLALTLVVAAAVALAVVLTTAATATEPVPTVVREVLASTRVADPPGHTLVLIRVTAMPGALLAKHRHPGTQSVSIVSGSVRYTVYRGNARIYHGPADAAAKPVRVITAGHSGTIRAGDWFTETPSLVHSAKVTSAGPFVVLLAGLLKTGEPLAIPVQ
jgi:hypothetical protein